MKRQGFVWYKAHKAGLIEELAEGYRFSYLPDYLASAQAQAISLTLPLSAKPVDTAQLHPFFDGLLPEGWLLDVAQCTWKLSPRDRMGVLLVACKDCVGAVSIEDCSEEEVYV